VALEVVIWLTDLFWSGAPAIAGILAFGTASVITLTVALAMSNERAFLASVLTLATASAFADLPVNRAGSTVFAAAAGALVLGFAEAGGAALEPSGTGKQLGRPTGARVAWVGAIAVGGGLLGWLIVSVRGGVADLGPLALGIGVAAAVGVILLAGTLTRSAVAGGATAGDGSGQRPGASLDGTDDLAAVTRLAPPAPSRRARLRGRGTRRAPHGHPPRSTPSSE
jgi:hypothetical protein